MRLGRTFSSCTIGIKSCWVLSALLTTTGLDKSQAVLSGLIHDDEPDRSAGIHDSHRQRDNRGYADHTKLLKPPVLWHPVASIISISDDFKTGSGANEDKRLSLASDSTTWPLGIVETRFHGQLGNNLFQYTAARTLADRLNWALYILPIKKEGGLLTPEAKACFPGVRGFGPDINNPEIRSLPVVGHRTFTGKHRRHSPPEHVVMNGFYKGYRLFARQKDRIRQILALDPSCCGETAPGVNDLVIHFRNYLGELGPSRYNTIKWDRFKDLGFEYYDTILRELAAAPGGSPDNIWIVGRFQPGNALVELLQTRYENIKVPDMVDNYLHAFCFLQRANRLAMADSTFSWWAAFLGRATEIHFPFGGKGSHLTSRLLVFDETRYVYRNHSGAVIQPLAEIPLSIPHKFPPDNL